MLILLLVFVSMLLINYLKYWFPFHSSPIDCIFCSHDRHTHNQPNPTQPNPYPVPFQPSPFTWSSICKLCRSWPELELSQNQIRNTRVGWIAYDAWLTADGLSRDEGRRASWMIKHKSPSIIMPKDWERKQPQEKIYLCNI